MFSIKFTAFVSLVAFACATTHALPQGLGINGGISVNPGIIPLPTPGASHSSDSSSANHGGLLGGLIPSQTSDGSVSATPADGLGFLGSLLHHSSTTTSSDTVPSSQATGGVDGDGEDTSEDGTGNSGSDGADNNDAGEGSDGDVLGEQV